MDDFGHLTPEDEIFLDEDVLRDEYDPDRILERSDKLNEYLKMFKEVVRGKRPRNVFVYGPTGVGKTVGTKVVLDRLTEDAEEIDQVSVEAVHLECKDLNTSYQVAANLVNKLRVNTGRSTISTTGYPEGEIYRMLFQELREADDTHVIIALDEIDNIGSDDNILYKLPRCNNTNSAQYVDPEDTKVGVVGITNDGTFRDRLDPRAQSTLCDHEIHFPPYDANELRTILNDRAGDAFKPGVLEDDVVPLVAAFAAQRSGYARTALELLYASGKRASDEGASSVTEEHVRNAESRLQQGAVVTEINGLSPQGKLITYTLVLMDDRNELPARMDKLYARYKDMARRMDVDTITPRSVHNILNDLMMNGIVTSKEINKGRSGGRHYQYELGTEYDLVAEGLQGDSDIEDIDDGLL
ncbi:orc1/cdc6 family replication initiation protein [Natronoarchaeum mannanilyticum]|uniref:ORC1-type DNA replication protein n=1 Tax=Natronoarchaeum mannanilyticum TaxID=926360 RepID=A0AAV3TCM5_9EURY